MKKGHKTKGDVYKYLSSIGRSGGSQTSDAKRKAVRKNGKLGGRPRKEKVKVSGHSENT